MISESRNKDLAFVIGIPLLIGATYYISKKKYLSSRREPQPKQEKIACIELGGTSIRLAIGIRETFSCGKKQFSIVEGKQKTITTTDPQSNVEQIKEYFLNEQVDKVGIASFGPICLDETQENYGYITTTPKQIWQNFGIVQSVAQAIPHRVIEKIGFDTDVNAAALAEFASGAHEAKQSLAYITVGTGVGVGLIINQKCVHGLTHPEGGHILIQPYPNDTFQGICRTHGNCIEGLVSNHAIAARLKTDINKLAELSDDNEVWDIVAFYLAQLCLSLTLISSPEVIVIGGGIMNRKGILENIQIQFKKLLNGYVNHQRLNEVTPFYTDSGLIGAMVI